jgi:hypothetical protein
VDSYLCRSFAKKALCIAALSALAGACAATGDDPPITPLSDAGSNVATPDAGMQPPTNACTTIDEGTQRACPCTDGTQGSQACLGGSYQPCKCAAPVTTTVQQLCKAGFYSGEFTGKYKPGAFGFGIIGSFIEVDIMGSKSGNYPALSFTLEAKQEGGGEFPTFAVKNGCMIGSANAYGTTNPFVGLISGELDCRTGKFSGTITGRYDLLNFGLKFDFTGPVESQFEVPQFRLKDGTWNVKEPPALDGTPAGGGGGAWSAIWESAMAPSGEDPCSSSALAPDGGTSTDAGSSTRSDAGSP